MPRGGLKNMKVSFKGCTDTIEDLFGAKPIAVTQMTKSLWGYVKKYKLIKK